MNNAKELQNLQFQRLVVYSIIGIGLIVFVALTYMDQKELRMLWAGEATLTCLIGNEEKLINPDMITGNIEGVWQFKNGYASQCRFELVK